MADKTNSIEKAKTLLKEGDNLVSNKNFDEAIMKFMFVPKYTKDLGDYNLTTLAYIKIISIFIMKKEFQQAGKYVSFALTTAPLCSDPDIQKEFLMLIKNHPELQQEHIRNVDNIP